MEVLGFVSAVFIGISLGLIGGGGSILTVPVLLYMLGVSPVLATAYSLFVVGFSSLVGAVKNYRKKQLCVKTAVVFAIPSIVAVYLTRLWLIPTLPDNFAFLNNMSKDTVIMLFFALIMLLAAFAMLKPKKKRKDKSKKVFTTKTYLMIILEGLLVGTLTGIVGAGGGFLIIPALVLLANLPMKQAVGTSLFIIAVKSLMGFLGDLQSGQEIEWTFLLSFTFLAVLGIFTGTYISKFVSGEKLKKAFGYFVLAMSVIIIFNELYI